jgi:hypothetical protein
MKRYLILLVVLISVSGMASSAIRTKDIIKVRHIKKIIIKGKITDAINNRPMTGVTVSMDGKALTQANLDGKYTVVVPEGATLTFSTLGYAIQTIKLRAGQAICDVKLYPNAPIAGDEVVRGYIKKNQYQITPTPFRINGSEVRDNPVGNVEELLQGKVASLNFQNNTGARGLRGSVNIRNLAYGRLNGKDYTGGSV